MVTDSSKLPRETYYACPHCMLKLELLLDDNRSHSPSHVHVGTVDEETLLAQFEIGDRKRRFGEAVSSPHTTRPSKTCNHFFGYLRSLPENADIPDECSVCPNIVRCYIKRE